MMVEIDKLGNIHYGYIGSAVGFNDFELTWVDRWEGLPTSDPEDIPAIRLGRQLWQSKEGALTRQEFDESLVRYTAWRNGVPLDPLARIEIVPLS